MRIEGVIEIPTILFEKAFRLGDRVLGDSDVHRYVGTILERDFIREGAAAYDVDQIQVQSLTVRSIESEEESDVPRAE